MEEMMAAFGQDVRNDEGSLPTMPEAKIAESWKRFTVIWMN